MKYFYPLSLLGIFSLYFLLGQISMLIPFEHFFASLCGAVFLIWIWLWERLRPFSRSWLRGNETLKDAFSTMVMIPIVMAASELFWKAIRSHYLQNWEVWPDHWHVSLQFIFALLVAELAFYGIHRLSHQSEFFWSFHKEHHSVPRIYLLNSGRLHLVDAILNFFVYFAPVLILGIPEHLFSAFLLLTMTTGTLEHANINFPADGWNRIFNTPDLHRWHHSKSVTISCHNFGKILSIWDTIFATYFKDSTSMNVLEIGIQEPLNSTSESTLIGS
jgi:ornithine lipid hydroxylase